MPVEGVNAAFQAQVQQSANIQGAQGAKTVFMGHTVAVETSPASLLADAAEELGFSVDRTKDFALEQRKQRESTEIGERLLKLYLVLMQQTGKSEQLNQVVDTLKRLSDRTAMQRALLDVFKDPSDGAAALRYALDAFETDPAISADQKKELQALADDFNRENAQSIRLGMQGALAGENFPELGTCDETRDLYRHTVGDFSDVNEGFSEIKAKYGEKFDLAMVFLFSALSADIQTETPSMGRAHLESIHHKLGLVRLTQSVYLLCEQTIDRWQNVHQVRVVMTPMALLEYFMTLREKNFLSAMQIENIVKEASPPDIEHEVLFTQDLLSLTRQLPSDFFEDESKRAALMTAVQEAVNHAVDREDEWLASLE